MLRDDLPGVMSVSAAYAARHWSEISEAVRAGGYVRVLDLRRGTEFYLTPHAPSGVVPDLTLARARRARTGGRGRRFSSTWQPGKREASG